jgi:hypothetical protein
MSQEANETRTYIGDSVYACIEDGMIKLTTEDGRSTTNTIFLDPDTWANLQAWVKPFIRGANYGKAIR